MKASSKIEIDAGNLSSNLKADKVRILPMSFTDEKRQDEFKGAYPPINIKPSLFIPDLYEKGLDNPAYYSPSEARKSVHKHRFTSKTLPGETNAAKLTKIPGLNIWRLDFRKPSSNTSRSSSPWYKLMTSLALVAVLALVVTGVAVIVHAVRGGVIFGLPWFPFENHHEEPEQIHRIAAHFKIMNRPFVPELQNPKSLEYMQLVAELKHSLDVLFMDSPLVSIYNTSKDFVFTNGSVVVRCVVLLKRHLPDGAQKVGFAFVRALEESKGILPPGMLYVDIHTVRFAGIRVELQNNHHESLIEIANWTEWSSCIKNGSCDSSGVRVRKRTCSPSMEELCETHTEIVETKPCLCPSTVMTLTTASLLLPGEWGEWSAWSPCMTMRRPMCDPQQIQRRTRNCVGGPGTTTGVLPNTVCIRKTRGSAMQIRHCVCSTERFAADGDIVQGTTLEMLNRDYMDWMLPFHK